MVQDVEIERATRLALHGGDDYELLFTVAPSRARHIPGKFRGLPITQVGKIVRERKTEVCAENGSVYRLKPHGWDPFRS